MVGQSPIQLISPNGLIGVDQSGQMYVNGYPVLNSLARAAQQFAVNLGAYETLTQSLYDSAAYLAAGQNQIMFFQTAAGAGTGVISNVPKTNEDTNMQFAGAMPNMQAYIVSSIEIEFQAGVSSAGFASADLPSTLAVPSVVAAINDQYKFRSTGYLQFNIGSKAYMTEGPLMKFPASNEYQIDGALSDTTTAGATQASRVVQGRAAGPAYQLAPNNLFLIPMQNFNVTLNWATVETVSAAARIFVRLMGQLIRAAQ